MLPPMHNADEAEMREFYRRMGISPDVIERAVKVRYAPPAEQYVDGRGKGPQEPKKKPPGRSRTK